MMTPSGGIGDRHAGPRPAFIVRPLRHGSHDRRDGQRHGNRYGRPGRAIGSELDRARVASGSQP